MKKIILVTVFICLILVSVSVCAADDVMKISMAGNTLKAKDIGLGKGVTFTLPELENNEFYICGIEIAVFEKAYDEDNWRIYTDDNGNEIKKQYIENPESLTFNVDFGNPKDYRSKAKYKIGYRYYVKNIYDDSILTIAGLEQKDGWRLVGENTTTVASEDGFVFYKNSLPEIQVECFSYKCHDINGLVTNDCSESELHERYFPYDAFDNGITVQLIANDFDSEDILTVSYRLEDAVTGNEIISGAMPADYKIKTDYHTEMYCLYITVSDDFGGSVTSEGYLFMIDSETPTVKNEFDDGGYALKGNNLFSDFYINDDYDEPMSSGKVCAYIYHQEKLLKNAVLEKQTNGAYRLDEKNMANGEYTVHLKIYDKSGNEGEHYFYQILDGTAPDMEFISPAENSNATYFSKWMNVSKQIIATITDEYAGIREYDMYTNGNISYSVTYNPIKPAVSVNRQIGINKTGKIQYRFIVYDNAKEIDKSTNKYNECPGNSRTINRSVWIDKTNPLITINYNDNSWEEAPCTVTADFYDYPSSDFADDDSGIFEKMFAVTSSIDEEPVWRTYENGVTISDGGVFYVYFKATDNAGNTETAMRKVRINAKSQKVSRVRPTEEYKHTIYYSTPGFYVVKNTAYNTKYHFELADRDIVDNIKTTVKLVSKDNRSIYGFSECITPPTGTEERNIVFNMPYLDSELNELPDGVYDMLITITELKNDGSEVITETDVNDCVVVIKRNTPPTPVISVKDNKVCIVYPDEILAGSLNDETIKSHYKYQYKTVKDGESETNVYKRYTGEFEAGSFVVTALYTDIAGNTSVASKRIHNISEIEDEDRDILTEGNTITVEESRAADVYYIGIRREKKNGINNSVFDFIE